MSASRASRPPFPEDRLVLARRGELAEFDILDRYLEESATLRAAHQVGVDFDQMARVRAGDEALVQRAAERTLSRARAPRPRTRRVVALAVAAMVLGGSSLAAASAWKGELRGILELLPFVDAVPSAPVPKAQPKPKRAPRPLVQASPQPVVTSEVPVEVASSAPVSAKVTAEAPAPTVGLGATAADLFRRASEARRNGDLDGARILYVELMTRFPGSTEAHLSRVSLGKLLLLQGRAMEAEREFLAYLGAGSGELTEEALNGRAESLARLGRASEERRLWTDFLQRFPHSVYAARARKRLDELGGTGYDAGPWEASPSTAPPSRSF